MILIERSTQFVSCPLSNLVLGGSVVTMVGRHFGIDTYGHTGFTGTSLWIDPQLDLTVVLLTNRVYFGRANDDETYRFRIAVHEAVSRPFAQATA